MTMLEQMKRHIPDPYPSMYLDGYSPYEILEATTRKMYNDHLERKEEQEIPVFTLRTEVKIK